MGDSPTPDDAGQHGRAGDIVVAVDGSAGSRRALRWAHRFASITDAPLRAVQAWQYPASTSLPWVHGSTPIPDEVDRGICDEIATVVAEELTPDLPVDIEALRGPAATVLVARAARTEPRLLVLGSRGHGGFAGLLLGSVSRQCLEYAPCPVAIVPNADPRRNSQIANIVVGLDGSEESTNALQLAAEIATATRASVVGVHAFTPPFSELPPDLADELRSAAHARVREQFHHLDELAVTTQCILTEGDAREILPQSVVDHAADLLVVGATGFGTVDKMLGPVATHLGSHTPVPLIVVR